MPDPTSQLKAVRQETRERFARICNLVFKTALHAASSIGFKYQVLVYAPFRAPGLSADLSMRVREKNKGFAQKQYHPPATTPGTRVCYTASGAAFQPRADGLAFPCSWSTG